MKEIVNVIEEKEEELEEGDEYITLDKNVE